MASSFTFKFHTVQQQQHFFSLLLCKSPSTLNLCSSHSFSRFFTSSSPKPTPLFAVKDIHASLSTTDHETPTKNSRTRKRNPSGDSSLRTKYDRASRNGVGLVIEGNSEKRFTKDKKTRKNPGSRKRKETVSGDSLLGIKSSKTKDREVVNGKLAKKSSDISAQDSNVKVREKRIEKGSKKIKNDPAELKFRVELDMCSKRGDVMGAIQLYDRAQREGIQLGQYHYTVFLYLCSSAAVGVVKPAKSGNDIRTSDALGMSNSINSGGDKMLDGLDSNSSNGFADLEIKNDSNQGHDGQSDNRGIQLSEDLKKYALTKGFEIYEKMCTDNITMNEASLTAVGRMAMSMEDGDMAFDAVKKMKELGINPRLRSYTPALSTFCNNGDIDKAFAVEKHMLENGVYPEEPELEALLRVSVENGKGDEVYYLLHKLRTCVRKVSPSTADVIMKWFESKEAARVGKGKLDKRLIKETIQSKGGGWHGLGWLGKGRWNVSRTVVGDDALCKCCGEKLAMIDLDPTETDNFAESVASITIKRERNSSFQKFQKWLDYYGPFEAVIDAANVGLFSQRKFKPSRVNAVVNGIRQRLPSRKWPLIVLHNRRVNGDKMDQPVNRAYVDKWRNADALYATPTGSNDDWYWLYAAIKFKSLIVTNDEMRDHTFQLLGNDFFPRWKERHQVRFSFSEAGPAFHMPPPFSVVIQESEQGDWHIPVASNNDNEAERSWLCITRSNSHVTQKNSTPSGKDLQPLDRKKGQAKAASKNLGKIKSTLVNKENSRNTDKLKQKIYERLKNILSASVSPNHQTVLAEINSAEKLGDCVIDFQI